MKYSTGFHTFISLFKFRKRYLFLVFVLMKPMFSEAQTYVGAGLGTTTYWGDLNGPDNVDNFLNNSSLALFLHYNKDLSRWFDFRGSVLYGRMQGSDRNSTLSWQRERNLSFSTFIFDVSAKLNLKLFTWAPTSKFAFTPYLSGGFSFFVFNPQTEYRGITYNLKDLGTEGQGMQGYGQKYKGFDAALPIGGGAFFRVNEAFKIAVDINGYKTFTDHLDDVGRFYVSYPELLSGNGPIAAALGDRSPEFFGSGEPSSRPTGSPRGGKSTDYFIAGSISLFYNLDINGLNGSSRIRCPKF